MPEDIGWKIVSRIGILQRYHQIIIGEFSYPLVYLSTCWRNWVPPTTRFQFHSLNMTLLCYWHFLFFLSVHTFLPSSPMIQLTISMQSLSTAIPAQRSTLSRNGRWSTLFLIVGPLFTITTVTRLLSSLLQVTSQLTLLSGQQRGTREESMAQYSPLTASLSTTMQTSNPGF